MTEHPGTTPPTTNGSNDNIKIKRKMLSLSNNTSSSSSSDITRGKKIKITGCNGDGPSLMISDTERLINKYLSVSLNDDGCVLLEQIRQSFNTDDKISYTHTESGIEVYHEPFTHCIIPNFVSDQSFLHNLKDELTLQQSFHHKSNDLYQFKQTDDLKNIHTPHVETLKSVIYDQFRIWIQTLTAVSYTDIIDVNCSMFDYTDVLLCHDDELEGRRIAYILYLVPDWTRDDGGMLDLFNTDCNGEPRDIIKSIIPVWNNLIFFEVSPISFHQVSEVISREKCRLSVGGWLHGHPSSNNTTNTSTSVSVESSVTTTTTTNTDSSVSVERSVTTTDTNSGVSVERSVTTTDTTDTTTQHPSSSNSTLALKPYITTECDILRHWINPVYLNIEIQADIQDKFETESEIHLDNFLLPEKFDQLCSVLKCDKMLNWSWQGPANKCCYEMCNTDDTTSKPIRDLLTLLQSESMFLLLSNLTGLSLHPYTRQSESDEPISDVVVREGCFTDTNRDSGSITEVRRWSNGCYTLVHDTDVYRQQYALDVLLYFNVPESTYTTECGGFTTYISEGDEEELLTVTPCNNSLALVYRDKETMRFIKYINNTFTTHTDTTSTSTSGEHFHDISGVYYE